MATEAKEAIATCFARLRAEADVGILDSSLIEIINLALRGMNTNNIGLVLLC